MNNKSIWITGASSGIGRALAIKFAKEGWQVAISARRENLLNEISQTNENIKTLRRNFFVNNRVAHYLS